MAFAGKVSHSPQLRILDNIRAEAGSSLRSRSDSGVCVLDEMSRAASLEGAGRDVCPDAVVQSADDDQFSDCIDSSSEGEQEKNEEEEFQDAVEDTTACVTIEKTLWKKVARALNNVFRDGQYERHTRLHASEDEDGFIPVQLVANEKNIRQATKDWRIVAQCVATNTSASRKFEASPDGSRVRKRQLPPKEHSETPFERGSAADRSDSLSTSPPATLSSFLIVEGLSGRTPEEVETAALQTCKGLEGDFEIIIPTDVPEDVFRYCSANDVSRLQQSLKRGGVALVRLASRRAASIASSLPDSNWRSAVSSYVILPVDMVNKSKSAGASPKFGRKQVKGATRDTHTPSPPVGSFTALKSSSPFLRRKMGHSDQQHVVAIIRQPFGPDGRIGFRRRD